MIQLDPLEDVLFRGWMQANRLIKRRQEPEDIEPKIDYRQLYRDTGGEVFPYNVFGRILKEATAGEQTDGSNKNRN